MKRNFISISLILFSVLIFWVSPPLKAQSGKSPPKVDTTVYKDNYLELMGNIYRFVGEAEKDDKLPPLDSAIITVSTVEGQFTRVITNKKGKCDFKLPLNRQYKILVSKKGYVSKFFEVNTKITTNKQAAYTFKFDVDYSFKHAQIFKF